jgi:hypothetical protein
MLSGQVADGVMTIVAGEMVLKPNQLDQNSVFFYRQTVKTVNHQ